LITKDTKRSEGHEAPHEGLGGRRSVSCTILIFLIFVIFVALRAFVV